MYKSCKTMVRCGVGVTEIQGGGETASSIGSESLLVRYGDGQADRQG